MSAVHHHNCPVCKQNRLEKVLIISDHSVSKEAFAVWECADCSLRFTQDVPDQASIGRYYASDAYISHTDTRKGLISVLYHWVRSFTLVSKLRLVIRVTRRKTGNLLDIGAGTGAFLHTMKKAGWLVTGLEPDAGARKIAKAKHQLVLLESDALFKLDSAKYDAITLWHVLEHVHSLDEYLDTISKLLKQEGKLIVAVPNYSSGDAAHYQTYWAAYDVPRHLYHFSPKSMRILMQAHGLEVVETRPMWFDSFYVSMLSESYRPQGGGIVSAFWQGLKSNWKAIKDKERASSLIYVIRKRSA
jgi:SAM-dependent methyltransferase